MSGKKGKVLYMSGHRLGKLLWMQAQGDLAWKYPGNATREIPEKTTLGTTVPPQAAGHASK